MEDRRTSERLVAAGDSGAVIYQDQRIPIEIVNLSLGGAQLQFPAECTLAPGADCTLEISDARHQQDLHLDTEVVWSRDKLLGLRMSWLAPEQRYYLNRLLSAWAQEPQLGGVAVC